MVELPGIGAERHGPIAGMFFVAAEAGGFHGPMTVGVLSHASCDFATSLWAIAGVSALLLAGGLLGRIGWQSGMAKID